MTATLQDTHSHTLVITACWCGIRHAVPDSLYRLAQQNRGKQSVYCPLGHAWVVTGKSDAQCEREKREEVERALVAAHERAHQQRQHLEASLRAVKGHATRLRKRVAAGVCPCCNRTFQDLSRHMAGQHPTFVEGGKG